MSLYLGVSLNKSAFPAQWNRLEMKLLVGGTPRAGASSPAVVQSSHTAWCKLPVPKIQPINVPGMKYPLI